MYIVKCIWEIKLKEKIMKKIMCLTQSIILVIILSPSIIYCSQQQNEVNDRLAANLGLAVTSRNSPSAPKSACPIGPVNRQANYQINWNHIQETFRGAAGMQVGGNWYAASFGELQGGTWYHLATTYDGENLKTYKDGVLITNNSDPSGIPYTENETLKLGRHAVTKDCFGGTIDDVRIYNYALSEGEITALHNEGKSK